jgi:hypothetical protein
MSEKLYTRLFRLYPSRFRKEYEAEALQLIRDRLRDETGLVKRVRLLWDLVADFLVGLPQAYRNSYAVTESQPLPLNAEGIPIFRLLDTEPIGRGAILLGGTLSLATIVAFGFLLNRSMAHLPVLARNGRMSPIEAVVERLNGTTTPDTFISGPEPSGSNSVVASEPQPPTESASLSESNSVVAGQNHVVPIPNQNPGESSLYLTMQPPASEVSAWRGALTDASGKPVRAAEIHLIGGHGELVANTAADGSFAFSELTSGDYEVAVVLDGREIAYRKALHLSATSSPSRLTLASGGRLLVSPPNKLP